MADLDFDTLAASLRADLGDVGVFLSALAAKLEGALPHRTTVKRRSVRFRSKEKYVEELVVLCGKNRYSLTMTGSGDLVACRSTEVRGIALNHDELSLEQWIDSLAQDLAAEAASSDAGRQALERLLF